MNSRLLFWAYLAAAVTLGALAYPCFFAQGRLAAFYGAPVLDLVASHAFSACGVLLLGLTLLAISSLVLGQMTFPVTLVLLLSHFGLFLADVVAVSRGTPVQVPLMLAKMTVLLGVSALLFRAWQWSAAKVDPVVIQPQLPLEQEGDRLSEQASSGEDA